MALGKNKPSGILSPRENHEVFSMLGPRVQSLSTAVVQLLMASPTASEWRLVTTGVACLAKDSIRRSYFIQIFDFDHRQRVWEEELYCEMRYRTRDSKFHTFEVENSIAGISFLDDREADDFRYYCMVNYNSLLYYQNNIFIKMVPLMINPF